MAVDASAVSAMTLPRVGTQTKAGEQLTYAKVTRKSESDVVFETGMATIAAAVMILRW